MPKLAEFFLLSAAMVCNGLVLVGSQGHPSSVCVLTDAPTQCGAFCLAALNPIIDDLADLRNQFTTMAVVQKESQEVWDRKQQETKSMMDEMLKETRAMLNSIKENTKDRQQDINSKLTNIETQLQQKLKGDGQQPPIQDTQIVHQTNPRTDVRPIGAKKWEIVLTIKTWIDAEAHCRSLGGHLADFQNKEEVENLKRKIAIHLLVSFTFWVGINDREKENEFVSVASGKKAPFLDWSDGEPNNNNGEDCVEISSGQMNDNNCNKQFFFICQYYDNN
ncbi:collectin-11-like [Drosophila rhopaloa]|uniref:C-type lectin domain-containing protein n=1 Tax=Drosophila rhopaloa TaxID=1041015 RepID=A0ABM5J4M0_DRORH|nr:collectin-11-like [Drosophila rhopaloa]